jgi:hypothetical protein
MFKVLVLQTLDHWSYRFEAMLRALQHCRPPQRGIGGLQGVVSHGDSLPRFPAGLTSPRPDVPYGGSSATCAMAATAFSRGDRSRAVFFAPDVGAKWAAGRPSASHRDTFGGLTRRARPSSPRTRNDERPSSDRIPSTPVCLIAAVTEALRRNPGSGPRGFASDTLSGRTRCSARGLARSRPPVPWRAARCGAPH